MWGAGVPTKDLVGFTETEGEIVLLHQLAVLFGAFATHPGERCELLVSSVI